MTCKKCEKDFVWEFTNKKTLCKEHFIRYVEKKVRYTLRRYRMLDVSDSLFIGDNEKKEIIMSLISDVCKQRACMINTKKANKTVLGDCLDDISLKIIHEMIYGKEKDMNKFLPVVEQNGIIVIKPLCLLLEKEIEIYSKLKGVEYNAKKKGENGIRIFIDELEKEHKEVKNAIVRGYLKLFC